MDPIYVTGHRNPDTDSIVSAMAYAALRNALGDREFVAARLGHISDETALVLKRFGFEPPVRIQTMRTQVRDLDYDTPPALSGAVTINRAWDALQSNRNIPSIPVTTEDGHLYGMLSPSEIASYDMKTVTDAYVSEIPVFNLLSVLEGKIINESGYLADTISGEVSIALPQNNANLLFSKQDSVVICGQQPEMARRAIEMGVSCLIVCQAELPEELRAIQTRTCIIATPYDAFKAARMIYHAHPRAAHLPHRGSGGLPSDRLPRRREGGRAQEPPPQLPHSRRKREGRGHAVAVSSHQAAPQARRAGRPQ